MDVGFGVGVSVGMGVGMGVGVNMGVCLGVGVDVNGCGRVWRGCGYGCDHLVKVWVWGVVYFGLLHRDLLVVD